MENAEIHFKNRAAKYNHSSNWVEDQALINRIFELSGAGPDSQVLDLATGTGLIAKQFFGKVQKITGLDISPEMAKHAEGCMDEIVFAPAEQMPFPDNSFDAIVCRQGLQFAELDRAIPEIHRVLKLGGTVVLCHLTAYNDTDRELTFAIQKLRNPARRNYLMPADISAALLKQGFREVEDIEYVTDESVNKWIDNGAIPQENMDGIRGLYRSASAEFKQIHNIRFTDDDILDEMLLVIATGRK
ncbi:putative methyltransferase YcgJ [Geobacter sp. OR-1]|uniref:class I SAM-dependent methyltransferase n=1 Tax=Geobacter sp. OR-1 TaxID=1266765 RepID=UPI0005423363|nr:methyltransferase domain-containing protein [Geobacter sp. OR-1]GAM09269.1 putative methyltransferase YcgJ [Geobacter sp. OR-1]